MHTKKCGDKMDDIQTKQYTKKIKQNECKSVSFIIIIHEMINIINTNYYIVNIKR